MNRLFFPIWRVFFLTGMFFFTVQMALITVTSGENWWKYAIVVFILSVIFYMSWTILDGKPQIVVTSTHIFIRNSELGWLRLINYRISQLMGIDAMVYPLLQIFGMQRCDIDLKFKNGRHKTLMSSYNQYEATYIAQELQSYIFDKFEQDATPDSDVNPFEA
ncbi:MAG: hypothetical protein H7Y11_15270 [Armatimonadetes bacterium]|nr:hypothetical protein [Anaerolineae bacterium]